MLEPERSKGRRNDDDDDADDAVNADWAGRGPRGSGGQQRL
jgi:hypothetical protein